VRSLARRGERHNKRFEQSPDSNVSIHQNPGFYVYVWPLRARLPLGTAQLKRSVMFRSEMRTCPHGTIAPPHE
jgi:hypothetical protein